MSVPEKSYIGYEYKELQVPENQISFCLDCYESLGWELDQRALKGRKGLIIRRDRRCLNRAELTRLQRHFEACMLEIEKLEKRKDSKATIWSLTVGLTGCAFLAGAVFAVVAPRPLYLLMALLAVPGFACWGAAPFVYRRLLAKQTEIADALIEQKYDEIYEICRKGSSLL